MSCVSDSYEDEILSEYTQSGCSIFGRPNLGSPTGGLLKEQYWKINQGEKLPFYETSQDPFTLSIVLSENKNIVGLIQEKQNLQRYSYEYKKLKNFEGFFHDGSIINLQHVGNEIELSIESAEIDPEELTDVSIPTFNRRILGKIHFRNVKRVFCDSGDPYRLKFVNGDILNIVFDPNKVVIQFESREFSSEIFNSLFSVIEIEADMIWLTRLV